MTANPFVGTTELHGRPGMTRSESDHASVDESDVRIRVHQSRGTKQRPFNQEIIGGEKQVIVTGDPLQPLVVSSNVSPVHGMAAKLDASILGGQGGGHLGRVIGRRVIDDQDAHIHRLPEHALDALAEESSVVVTGHDHVDTAHGCRSSREQAGRCPSQ